MSIDLNAIQARTDAATKAPWFREYSDVVTAHQDPRDVEEGYEDARNSRVVRGAPHLPKKDGQGIADAEFIAHARTDVPALLALVRDLDARIGEAKAEAWDEGMTYSFTLLNADEFVPSFRKENPYRTALTATEAS